MPVAARLDRIARRPLASAVFDQLLERIVSGAFAPGQALPAERLLCQELGVSRTAVREALARLAQVRLIAIRHGGDTRVLDFRTSAGLDLLPRIVRSRVSPRLLLELARSGFEMRAVLAPDVARLAAERGGPAVADDLAAPLADMAASDDLAALQDASLRFWGALALGSGNLAYQLAFNTLREAIEGLRGVADAQATELRDRKGYRAIADAVRKEDGGAAARAARAHIELGMGGLAAFTGKKK